MYSRFGHRPSSKSGNMAKIAFKNIFLLYCKICWSEQVRRERFGDYNYEIFDTRL